MVSFMDQLRQAIEEGKLKQEELKKNPPVPGQPLKPQKPSIKDKILGIKGAFFRAKASGIFNPSTYCSIDELSERIVCCSTCTEGMTCPYCGCVIQGKRLLKTENCPSTETYPHLKKFPPRQYWDVCEQTTSVFIVYENKGDINKTIDQLIEHATGKIEILVGLNNSDVNIYKRDNVKVGKSNEDISNREFINQLSQIATGDFFFICDPEIEVEKGWDTKLKCACDPMTISTAPLMVDGKKIFSFNLDDVYEWNPFDGLNDAMKDTKEILSQILLFHPRCWMIKKETFLRYGCFDENYGFHDDENIEWMLKVALRGGKIVSRTDLTFKLPNISQCVKPSHQFLYLDFIKRLEVNNEFIKKLEDIKREYCEKFSNTSS